MPNTSKYVILITGGAGFIGSHVVRHFVINYPHYQIVNLDALTYAGNLENLKDIKNYDNYTFEKGDITDKSFLDALFRTYNFNAIIHLAAESHVDRSITGPTIFARTNVVGTLNLLECARELIEKGNSQIKFYHVSTDEVFGSLPEKGLFYEHSPYSPNSPYAASKASSDHFVRAYGKTYNLPYLISNCSNNYGPNQFPEKLIPMLITRLTNNLTVPIYGDGSNIRDWLYVIDHANAIDVVFHKGKIGETYNIGGNNQWTNLDLTNYLCDILDSKLNRQQGTSRKLITFVKDRPGHDKRYAISTEKIKNQLGWKPDYGFEQGLNSTVEWYLNNSQWVENIRSGQYRQL